MVINQVQILAPTQLPAAAAAQVTVPANTTYRIGRAGFSNPTGGALTVTAYLVPNGGAPSAANEIVPGVTVAPGYTYPAPELAGLVMPAGSTLQMFASAAASIVAYVSGVSIQ